VEGVLDEQGRACLTVVDHGRWRTPEPDPGRRGRGLLMMRGCMDTVEVEATAEGTTVLLDRRLRRESGGRPRAHRQPHDPAAASGRDGRGDTRSKRPSIQSAARST
jgi:hypothetical protein